MLKNRKRSQSGDLLARLADGTEDLASTLRAALILPSVAAAHEFRDWVNRELSGYDNADVPEYRVKELSMQGDASNRAWSVTGQALPTASLPEDLRDYATRPHEFRESIGELESLIESGESSFGIEWPSDSVAYLNAVIARGSTGINDTYGFSRAYWSVPAGVVHGILNQVRQQALTGLVELTPADEREHQDMDDETTTEPQGVSVQGSGNQIMIGSPGAAQTLTINRGDWTALLNALTAMGVDPTEVEGLRAELDAEEREESRIMRAVRWSRKQAVALGINAAGGTIAGLILQYLGVV